MLLNLAEELYLDAAPESVWKVLRDTPRLAALLPGVESVTPLEEPGAEAYAAVVRDKIGPFKITLNLELRVMQVTDHAFLKASLKGGDAHNLNRVSGTLQAQLSPANGEPAHGSKMRFEASVEVLGKLATLGAVPIKRRTTQIFAEFARNIQAQFAPEKS